MDTFSGKSPTVNISVTSSSQRVAFPGKGSKEYLVSADTTGTCFINTGDSTVTASETTNTPVLSQTQQKFGKESADTYFAAICPSGSGTIYISEGPGE